MKAVEFVKEFGWDRASHVCKMLEDYKYFKASFRNANIKATQSDVFSNGYMLAEELKQLIEAKELVDSFGGFGEANKVVCNAYHGSNHPIPDGHEELSVAIQLMESVNA